MSNIIIISTVHLEVGKCTSEELYKIIESIRPEVIFEELSGEHFDILYNENVSDRESLEVKCIKKYLINHNIKHIAVDIDVSKDLSKRDIDYLFDSFDKYVDYRKLTQEQDLLTAQEGFAYLNSKELLELFKRKACTERHIIETAGINKNILAHFYKLFHEEQDNRENEMIKNIYNYSRNSQYGQAVFLLGAAHRNSLIQKIAVCKTKEELNLNWIFYGESHT